MISSSNEFRNLLAILGSLDYEEVDHIFEDIRKYSCFAAEPMRTYLLLDDERREKLWQVIEGRRGGSGSATRNITVASGPGGISRP